METFGALLNSTLLKNPHNKFELSYLKNIGGDRFLVEAGS